MKFKAGMLVKLIDFLNTIGLKGRASLGRTKLRDALITKHSEVSDDQMAIVEEYDAWKDQAKGTFEIVNDEMRVSLEDILNQDIVVEIHSPFLKDLAEALGEHPTEWSEEDAIYFAILYESVLGEVEKSK